jgi:hypothetical protein
VEAVLEIFGEYFLEYCMRHGYDKMMKTLGEDFASFVQNLDSFHALLSMSYENIDAPSFRLVEHPMPPHSGINRDAECFEANTAKNKMAGALPKYSKSHKCSILVTEHHICNFVRRRIRFNNPMHIQKYWTYFEGNAGLS